MKGGVFDQRTACMNENIVSAVVRMENGLGRRFDGILIQYKVY